MATVTPSAKSYERATGRWVRDFEPRTPRDWFVYYVKVIAGTPIPWFLWSFAVIVYYSNAGAEIAAWSSAGLTLVYIIADYFGSTQEFRPFLIGGDIFLFGFSVATICSAVMSDTALDAVGTLTTMRWVLLLYLLTYCWELFPGLNRAFNFLIGAGFIAALYGIWQHFTGLDLIRNLALEQAPVTNAALFIPHGFFNSPEAFGTMLALIAPYPIAAYLCASDREPATRRFAALAFSLLMLLAVFWTYLPGLWIAAFASVLVAALMQPRRLFGALGIIAVFFVIMLSLTYNSIEGMLSSVQSNAAIRSEKQRLQINTQVELWQNNPWFGVGHKAQEALNYDPSTNNIYFQVLAQAGLIGLVFYLLFILGLLLATYRIFDDIPQIHYWHRVLVVGSIASQIAFHISGLYWSTLAEPVALNLFVLLASATCYLIEHYRRGLVADDESL